MMATAPSGVDDTPLLPVSLTTEHGTLHGQLGVVAASPGLIVLAHDTQKLDARAQTLAHYFHRATLSTLSVDLLASREEQFPDVHSNVPLLAKRLTDFLGLLRHRIEMGELPEQPIGLHATCATSPVAVRVAALRDHDVAAVVCHGGLLDLAGVQYLRALRSPILLLEDDSSPDDDPQRLSNHRALEEIRCARQIQPVPNAGIHYALSSGFEIATDEAIRWFLRQFATDR